MKTILYNAFTALCIVTWGCGQSTPSHADSFAETETGDTNAVIKYTDFSRTPTYIKRALDTIDGGEFLIANPGEQWNAGCCQMDGEPGKELVWASVDKNRFLIVFNQGGIAMTRTFMRLNFDGEKLVSYSRNGELFRWTAKELEK